MPIDAIAFESIDMPTTVYIFKVEDYHIYYVGNTTVLVHNADCAQIIKDVESGKTELKNS